MCVVWASPSAANVISLESPLSITIGYHATDLDDIDAGRDLWQFAYYVSDFDLPIGHGFSIYFSEYLYRNLQTSPNPPNADWDVHTVPVDAASWSPGVYDGLALSNHPTLSEPFLVRFEWLGGPGYSPQPQHFDIYKIDAVSGNVSSIGAGKTQRVPEPSSLLLMGVAAGAGLAERFRRKLLSSAIDG